MLKKRTTESLIIESTSELLRANDLERITVRAIANNAGITTQTFYNHFRDKFEVVARLYTRSMAPYAMSPLSKWYEVKSTLFTSDMPLFNHAFDYVGQNSLTSTLVSFDQQKYALHISPGIPRGSLEYKLINLGILSLIYGQFGLYEAMRHATFDISSEEYAQRFSSVREIMELWGPKVLEGNLLEDPQCENAHWDEASESMIVVGRTN